MSATTVHFVSLGCPKNQVDTEQMMGLTRQLGLELVFEPDQAETIVVNTCGFIDAAKEESIETILELARYKEDGRCRSLVVAGCLSQRYREELAAGLPEVDHFIGAADLAGLRQALAADAGEDPLSDPLPDRVLTGTGASAYLKIAEGCDRQCAFCIIPAIRGRQVSRSVASLVAEARRLAGHGVVELNLVAQDTTAYGRDLAPATTLADLLEALDRVEGLRWIRLLYAYPSAVDDRLLATLSQMERLAPYLDLPIQHVDDGLLRRMRRGYRGADVERALERIRAALPDVHLRSTLLVGHPGESAAAHRALVEFVRRAELDHLGVFTFSAEEGTAAADQPDPVPAELAANRCRELMELQRGISRRRLAAMRGRVLPVLVEGCSPESELLLQGRHPGQAPEVDGAVILTSCAAAPGELVEAEITGASDYDLVATALGPHSLDPEREGG